MINVVNRNSYSGQGIFVMRGSILGNPFKIGKDGSRDEVIAKHHQFLWECMNNGSAVWQEIIRLSHKHAQGEDIVLICCCVPLKCHAFTIKRAIEWKANQILNEIHSRNSCRQPV